MFSNYRIKAENKLFQKLIDKNSVKPSLTVTSEEQSPLTTGHLYIEWNESHLNNIRLPSPLKSSLGQGKPL